MKKTITLIFVCFTAISFAQSSLNIVPVNIPGLEIPALKKGETLIKHTGYSLCYNEQYEQANWVAYELTAEETVGQYKRTNKFLVDPMVKTGTADNVDYLHSNLDRGHLAPAGDMGWSAKAMAESFYYSNMSPQEPTFNRGIWEDGEELVRSWAVDNKALYVVAGPVLTPGLRTIGPNKVAVPQYYFKVILDYTLPSIKAIGLILPNAAVNERPLKSYFVSVDSVEKFTGLDFFPALPDDQEQAIESHFKLSDWNWKLTKQAQPPKIPISSAPAAEAVQCSGITQKGKRCKKMTTNSNGRCALHQ